MPSQCMLMVERTVNSMTVPHLHKTTTEIDALLLHNEGFYDMLCPDKTLKKNIMTIRKQIIAEHEKSHSIWQNKSTGRWCTKLGVEKHLLVRKERRDLENAIVEFYLSDRKLSSTVDEVFRDWCQYESERTEHSMKTINEYTNDYNRFLGKTDFSSRPIHDITEQDIVHLMKTIVYGDEKIPLKRYKSVKTILRTIFNHAKIQLDIQCISVKNILDDLRFPRAIFKETQHTDANQVFKHSEIKLLKNFLKDTQDLCELGILLTLETGIRLGELCVLRREHVTDDYLLIRQSEHRAKFDGKRCYYIHEPKCHKLRDVILNDDAKQIIQRILELHDSEWLFPSEKDDTDWTRSYFFDKAIRKVCRRLSIPERSMHKLRKTYCSYILSQADVEITDKLVQEQLGHADISTTHRAYHYNIFDTEEKLNALSNIRIG